MPSKRCRRLQCDIHECRAHGAGFQKGIAVRTYCLHCHCFPATSAAARSDALALAQWMVPGSRTARVQRVIPGSTPYQYEIFCSYVCRRNYFGSNCPAEITVPDGNSLYLIVIEGGAVPP